MKKIISLFLSVCMVLSLSACGGGSASSGSASSKVVKSSLKGDFMFYSKDDGSYFTNNDSIPETYLADGGINDVDIYIDEKRKNIIFKDEYGIYTKSLNNLEEEMIEIGGCNNDSTALFYIWNNKVIVWRDRNSIFTYDLDSKKKDRISENVHCTSKVYGDSITYFENDITHNGVTTAYDGGEKKENIINKIVVYNIKNRSKKERDISKFEFNIKIYPKTADKIAYLVDDYTDENVAKLYKIIIDGDPTVIDEMETNFLKYTHKDEGFSRKASLGYNFVNIFPNGELYYKKRISYTKGKDFDRYGSYDYEYENYYYDGNISNKLDVANITNFEWNGHDLDSLTLPIVSYYGNEYGFIIRNQKYEGKDGLPSKEGNKILFRDKDDNKDKVLNVKSGEIIDVNKEISTLIYFDNDNLLYIANNGDLILNDEVIDYDVDDSKIKWNSDFSTIVYSTTNDALTVWNSGTVNTITNKAWDWQITNSNNVYYLKENKLYIYDGNESKMIYDNVREIQRYYLIK